MTFQSPFEDFVLNSLAAIGGLLAKLDYVAGLRQEDGGYNHWGLARVHGQDAAQQAAAEAHHLLFSRVLSTPVGELLQETAQSRPSEPALDDYLECLARNPSALAPEAAGRATLLHFNSVLHALLALAHSRGRTNPPAS